MERQSGITFYRNGNNFLLDIEKAVLDFIIDEEDELDEKDRKEAKFRCETARAARSSTKALWEELNQCAETELAKEDVLLILNGFIEYFEIFAELMNNNNATKVILHLRKVLSEIKQM